MDGQSASGAVAQRQLPGELIGKKRATIKAGDDQGRPRARIKQARQVPIGERRNKLPGAGPCTSLLREDGKGFEGEDDGKVT